MGYVYGVDDGLESQLYYVLGFQPTLVLSCLVGISRDRPVVEWNIWKQ